jgi:ectoine hydroxylase-related dioxygenase (phytanoyl-CoA dioxygenase family)
MRLSEQDIAAFERDGYFIFRSLFDADEMAALIAHAKADANLQSGASDRVDADGRASRITLWDHPRDDLYGRFSRCERLVVNASTLLGGQEVYHWHSKMMLKEPRVGGAWEWHQDYGYWYNGGCLLPDLISCMIAVDRADQENGCLQVLRGSHRMGRIDHGSVGGQTGADPERTALATEFFEHVHVTLEPGDTLFFHSNLMHRSDANLSDRPRWCLICCYNTRENSPRTEPHGHCKYTPLTTIADADVLG